MPIHISPSDAKAVVDSIELAISVLEERYHDCAPFSIIPDREIRKAIEDLQMMRVSYLLIARRAAKTDLRKVCDHIEEVHKPFNLQHEFTAG